MIRVNKSKVSKPAVLSFPLNDALILQLIRERNTHKFSNDIYRANEVLGKLKTIYNSKCAYCESNIEAGSTLAIEHYRPKNNVRDYVGHEGYYWLGYEWSNLLLACNKCNRAKWNHFKIRRDAWATVPLDPTTNYLVFSKCEIQHDELKHENPLLLNPEIDNPQEHLIFMPSGKINSKGSTRGDYTIELCKLNRRPLKISRKKILDNFLSKVVKFFKDFETHQNLHTVLYAIKDRLADLNETIIKNQPYSGFVKQILIHYNYFVVRRFPNTEHRNILLRAYREVFTP